MDLQKIMDRDKWCMFPLHLRHTKSNGSSQKGKLVEWSQKMNKVQRHADNQHSLLNSRVNAANKDGEAVDL